MLTERIWSGNALRNFHYLIACPETGEALAVDPLEWRLCLEAARVRGWRITQIVNTHEHGDHTGGNAPLKAATGATVAAHAGAASRIGGVDRGLARGDLIRVGRTVELECLDTPGHTMTHVCLLSHTEEPALFCGDTLFNAAAGDAHLPGPRVPGPQPRVHARPRAGQRGGGAAAGGGAHARSGRSARHHPGGGAAHQHLLPPAAAGGDRRAAGEVPRPAGAAGCADRVRQAARAAQPLVISAG